MLVPFPAKGPRPVGFLASSANRGFRVKRILDAVWLPLYHANSKRLIDVFAIRIRAGVVKRYADVRGCPWSSCVAIADAAHISCLKILLALFADRQATVWKLYVQGLFEPRRCEG